MLIAGIDPSAKKIAIVATHPTLNVSYVQSFMLYKTKETQTPASLGKALDAMDEFLAWAAGVAPQGEQRFAWVEDPLVGRGGVTTTMKQSYVGGIIRATLHNAGFTVYGVNVSSWKKDVLGNGRAQKPAVSAHLKRAWPKVHGLVGSDGDLADAAAINLYGRSVLAKAALMGPAGPAGGAVPGGRPRTMVRPARLQR
jgi:Holliday junction resolvasome RuvABC endonuclease subunit